MEIFSKDPLPIWRFSTLDGGTIWRFFEIPAPHMNFLMLKTPSYGDFFRARLRRAHMDFWVPHTSHMEIRRERLGPSI